MGLRGPKPKPTRQKELAGNPGRRPLYTTEPKPEMVDNPNPPRCFDKYAKEEWRRVVPEMVRLGILSVLDLGILESHCMAFSLKRRAEVEAEKYFKENRKLTRSYTNKAGANNEVPIPELGIMKQQADILKHTTAALGLSPADRSRVRIEKPPEKNNPLLLFLKGGSSTNEPS